MLNKVMLIGHVGGKPEIRRTQDGKPIASFSIATSQSWRDKTTGERKQSTQWHRVVCFNEGLCKIIEQYVDKGSKLFVEGIYRSRKWTDKKEIEREVFEVILPAFNGGITLLDRAERAPAADSAESYGSAPKGDASDPGPGAGKPPIDDEIPF